METDRRKTHITETERAGRNRGREEVINTNNYYTQRRRGQKIWIAVALVALALFLIFLASNNRRSAPTQVQVNDVPNAQDSQTRAVEDVRLQLQEVNRKLTETGNYEEAGESVARIREDFRVSFDQAGDKTGTSWQGVDDELNTIETQLRDKNVDVGDAINKLIDSLRNFRFDVTLPEAR